MSEESDRGARRYDAIVVGAGMSGLAAGIRLAQFDRRVVVLEKHEVWGGLNSFYGKDGHRFDVGLHALTNYVPRGTRGAPLTRALKQLRLRWDDLKLGEQGWSEILFPGRRLAFSNDPARMHAGVAELFPGEVDRFRALWDEIEASEWDVPAREPVSARAVLAERLDPDLAEMLLLPVCYYGSATADDIDWGQFKILFKSVYVEGLARPEGGVRTLLNLLVKRLKELGGELRTRAGVARIETDAGHVRGVVLEDGTELESDLVLSSAGHPETLTLTGRGQTPDPGDRLTFLESISVLDRDPLELGHGATTCFWSSEERFAYRPPAADELTDLRSGLTCAPSHYAVRPGGPTVEPMLRLTVLANGPDWCELAERDPELYARRKEEHAQASIDAFAAFCAREGFAEGARANWSAATTYRDTFTPSTVRRFTFHTGGAVYGSPVKRGDGETGISGLVLCGTDQGFLGIVGALNSGIMMANRHALAPAL